MSRLSLRFRFLLFSAVLIVLAVLLIGGAGYYEYHEATMRSVDRTLRTKADGLAAALNDGESPDSLKREADSIVGARRDKRSPMYRVWIDGAGGDLIASDPPDSDRGRWLREIGQAPGPDRSATQLAMIGRHRDEYRAIWVRKMGRSGRVRNVVVAESVHYALHEIGEMRNVLLIVAGCAAVAMLLFAVLAVRRTLRPIQVVARHLDRVTHRHMDGGALRGSPVPRELRPFVESAAKMLERLRRAFEVQDRFIADASHELRTPLAVAKSTLQTAAVRGGSVQAHKRAIAEALEDLDRVQHTIEQLLALARLSGEAAGGETEEIDVPAFLGVLAERYDARAAERGGRVVVQGGAAATVTGHRGDLERLFGNLLENAVVHGPPSGTVTIRTEDGADGEVVVSIHDEGGTIPPEELPHLFDRFYRADRSRSRDTGGAGLGLAIAREIARRHGGDIRMESSPDRGTRAVVHLPRRMEGPRQSA